MRRASVVLSLVLGASLLLAGPARAAGPVPTPESSFGFRPGADFKLADYEQIVRYFEALDAASDRVSVREMGKSAEGRPMIYALISSAENLKRLDHYLEISRKLAFAQGLDDAQARALAQEGKAIVWIDNGLHATEVAPAQHAPGLAYRLATEESPEMRRIRDDVILALVPVINPDGLDKVTAWYRRNLGTPFEVAPMVEVYNRWAGHDDNRDWYMFNLPESRHVARLLYRELLPQIVYNQHQTAPFPARIFVPPFDDPMNPNIPPEVMRGIATVGDAITSRLEAEGKVGAISRISFDTWWNGGMRTAPYFHNMVGILTETALWYYATPHDYEEKTLPKRFANGTPADAPSTSYPSPWRGGRWRLQDAVDYITTASLATLDVASKHRFDWLYGTYRMGREAIEAGEKGGPFAYVIPAAQRDPGALARFVDALRRGGVDVRRATAEFTAGGAAYPAGTLVVPMAQPFRAYAKDLLEAQRYPDRRQGPNGPPLRPYDIAGWTLPAQMGIAGAFVDAPFEATLEPLVAPFAPGRLEGSGPVLLLDAGADDAFAAANRALKAGASVARAGEAFDAGGRRFEAGAFVIEGLSHETALALVRERNLVAVAVSAAPEVKLQPVRARRVGLYRSWLPNADEGWTRYVLEEFEFPYRTLRDADVRKGGLERDYDVIVLPDASARQLLDGNLPGSVPPEYAGDIGVEGALALKRFVLAGGTLVALDSAADLASELLGTGVRNVLRDVPSSQYYCPGSLLRVDVDTRQPLAWGLPKQLFAFVENGPAFEDELAAGQGHERPDRPGPTRGPTGREPSRAIARFAQKDVLYSGWLLGESHIAGKLALVETPLGAGRVVLVGFRCQFRGQPWASFKVLFNALLT
jgi:Zinc carboxypeptidase